jgi:glycosyltransferase involved in cell wall biosynthesis
VKSRPLRVAWLAPYDTQQLQPEVRFVRETWPHTSGWIVNLAKALVRQSDVDLHILTASSGILSHHNVSKDGMTFHVIRHTVPFTARGFPRYMRLDVVTRYVTLRRRMKQVLEALQPDIIHVHGTENGYALAVFDTDKPIIVSLQGLVSAIAPSSGSVFLHLQAQIERSVIRAARYVGTRTAWANDLVRGLNAAAILYHLPEAINPVFFSVSPRPKAANILMVGTIVQRKGIEDALAAMPLVIERCEGARLIVVGDGRADYVAQLQRTASAAGIGDHIEWLGRKTPEEIAELHAASTVLIHPSHVDNSPNSIAEAMASGLPVVASDAGGIPSMIEHGATGLLIPSRQHRQLAEAIIRLLNNPGQRHELARRARCVARERHFPGCVASTTLDAYRDVIERANGTASRPHQRH